MRKNILVTGGAGFIGSNFVHYWVKNNPNDYVLVLDALTYAGNFNSIQSLKKHPGFTFVKGNICDSVLLEEILKQYSINTIVHFAAESHVDRSILDPEVFIQTNVMGTQRLLNAAKEYWSDRNKTECRFHHVSTDEVFGSLEIDEPPFSETSPYKPNSPYSASKAASDHIARSYFYTYGLNITTSNCSNNYGPYHYPEKLIPLIIINILHNKPLPVYGNGKQIRDWLYVEDHAAGIQLILEKGRAGHTYNLGGENEIRNIDLIFDICSLIDELFLESPILKTSYPIARMAASNSSSKLITHVKDRPGHDKRYALSIEKAKAELGFKSRESLKSGLRKTILWYLENDSWWKEIINDDYNNWIATQYSPNNSIK